MNSRAALLLAIVLSPAACEFAPRAAAADLTAVTASGERFAGRLVAATASGQLTFDVAGEPRVLPIGELRAWGMPVETHQDAQIVLTDGGLLVAPEVTLDEESLVAADGDFAPARGIGSSVQLPLSRAAGVLLNPPSDPAARDRLLLAIGSADAQADRVYLANGDALTGTLARLTPSAVEFESDVGLVELALDKVAAVAFDPALRAPAAERAAGLTIGLADGSRLGVASLELNDKVATIQLAGAAEAWKFDSDRIVWLRPERDDVVFLSDLAPASYKHVPFLDLAWPYRLNESVAGGLLRVGGRLYTRGVGMHSTARLTWELAEPFRRFEAEIALDDSAAERGSVVFRVFADNKEVFASPIVRGGADPLPIAADLGDAKRISLVVDFADRGDELDHADWLDARLVR